MTTQLGKLFVLANVFLSVGLFAWALSIYVNRPTYFDSKDGDTDVKGRFSQLTAETTRLTSAVSSLQSQYADAAFLLDNKEQERDYRGQTLQKLLDEVTKPENPDAVFRVPPRSQGLIDVFAFRMDTNPPPKFKNLRNKDLGGYGILQRKMDTLRKDELQLVADIRASEDVNEKMAQEIFDKSTDRGVLRELFKMKAISINLVDEAAYLADLRVNWEEQLRTLEFRKNQLLERLAR